MLTLGLTTATSTCGVALREDDRLLAEAHIHVDRSHARRLALLLTETLAHAGKLARELDAVAIVSGPGSFTGLRIGASTAKGLCLATGAALVAVPSHEALADRSVAADDWTLYVLPSRRGEVLAARTGPMRPIKLADLADFADGCRHVIGPNAADVRQALPDVVTTVRDIRAGVVARLGAARYTEGETVDAAAFEPNYGQAFVPSQPAPIFGDARP